jgi:hypothetical protein
MAVAFVVMSGDDTHGWSPEAVVLDPDRVADAVLEADRRYRLCYGDVGYPLSLDAFLLPKQGRSRLATRNVRIHCMEVY